MTTIRGFIFFWVALSLSGLWCVCASAQSKPDSGPAQDLVVGGERFAKRVISDPGQGGMTAAAMRVPETWRFESKIEWHYGWIETPILFSTQAENPASLEAYFSYPLVRCEVTEVPPGLQQYLPKPPNPGERIWTGAVWLAPRTPAQAMALFIQRVRAKADKLRWIGKQELPGLAKALNLQPWPGDQGIAVKIAYELNGQAVEEAFYAVYYLSKQPNPGGVSQTNWGLRSLQSFRAPEGTLDKRMPVFCAIARSFTVDPQWIERTRAINARLMALWNQHLKEGYDQMAAAQRLSEQIMKNQKEFLDSVSAWTLANRDSGGGRPAAGSTGSPEGPRNGANAFSDMMNNEDRVNDPLWGTSKRSNLEQYHFTDGFGNYIDTNDPNAVPPPNWERMTPAP
jgi:hypothetical protein